MSSSAPAPAVRPPHQQIAPPALTRQLRRLASLAEAPWLHADIARRMAERLPLIKMQPPRVLQWSAFLGASDALLRETYPKAEQRRVEPVPALRERSRVELKPGFWAALRQREAPAVWLPTEVEAGAAELLWANMYLHLSPDPEALLALWHRALAVDGFVMFSCLGPDSWRELRELYAALGWPSAGPEWIDMHDVGDMLVHAGFADPVMDQERITLTWSDPDKLLADLRALGGNLSPLRQPGLRTPAWRRRLLRELERLRGPDGRLRLSLELVYGHAFKPAPRLKVAGETRVSLDQMRDMVRGASKA
ncbi:biotin synthase [Roseateles sp. DAIF2]|uniref:biotin synthase n=1 Tax=Roseateles sp. DAIF2 TaxID=2714952 RepID=UPI0018A2B7BE|nr:biotin synthase [Roseateles sp. DAIF2]QPF72666.1 biotin synthase [Roseateles sp. DAIF2]